MQIEVEIVYVKPTLGALKLKLVMDAYSTIQDALIQSQLLTTHPEISSLPVGIFGKQKALDTLLKPGDRIEIYRPLLVDPMERRRKRALAKTK